MTGSKRNKTEP